MWACWIACAYRIASASDSSPGPEISAWWPAVWWKMIRRDRSHAVIAAFGCRAFQIPDR
jgi:hypothetical protein